MKRSTRLEIHGERIRELLPSELRNPLGKLRPDGSDRDWSCDICAPSAPTMCATTGPVSAG